MDMETPDPYRIEELVKLHYPVLFHFAKRLCGNPTEAMTLTQRTFREAYDATRTSRVSTNSRSWLFGTLLHLFLEERARIHAP